MQNGTTSSGLTAAAAVALIVVAGMLTACGPDEDEVVSIEEHEALQQELAEAQETAEAAKETQPQDLPWPYVQLDVEEVRKLGHEGYHVDSCSYGAFHAIVYPLQEELGHPYDQIPTYMLHFGRGGVAGSGSACGAVVGAMAAINLIAGEDYRPLASELVEYYETTPFPTQISNEYAAGGEFLVDDYIDTPQVQSTAGTINCDPSVEAWLAASGYERADAERSERCGRLTGDVAAKAAEILNAWAAAELIDVPDPASEFAHIFPDAEFELIEGHSHRVLEDGEVVGYAAIGAASGYEDLIIMAVGIDLDGNVHGAHVIEQNETPDIGDVIVEGDFLDQFQGLSEEELHLVAHDGAIDAVSGATVSCEVATDIVREQVGTLSEYLD